MPNDNQFGQTNGSFLSFLAFTSFFHPLSSALPYTNPHPLSRAPSFCLDPIISKNFPFSSCLSAFEARGFRTIILVCSKYVREDRGFGSLKQPAMQSQLVCSGCRSILLYPGGATNVCCALCNAITSVPPPGMEMTQLICGGCRTPLMYTRGAISVRCSCCHTVNLAPVSSQVAHVSCGNCRTTLMYPYGAPSVKCAVCHYVTNVGISNTRVPIPVHRPNGTANSGTVPFSSTSQTVVVENPMTVNESGKLVSSVVVGVTTDKK